jgi:hypothetical protein
MSPKRYVPNWKEVTLSALEAALSTGRIKHLPPDEMPGWARTVPAVSAAWLYYEGGIPLDSTGGLSTGAIHARIDIEREYQVGPRLRYDRYLFVKMADGRVFQAGPYKDVEYGHDHEIRPGWLDEYRSG